MTTMARVYIFLFFVSVIIGCAVADPTGKVTFKRVDIENVDNPYFGTWSADIEDGGERLTIKIPIKQDLTGDLMMKGTLKFNSMNLGKMDMPFCDLLKNEFVGRSLVQAVIPKGEFSQMCPVKANTAYVISKYQFPVDKIPIGIPNGKVFIDLELFKTGESPYIKITMEIAYSHKFPRLGRSL